MIYHFMHYFGFRGEPSFCCLTDEQKLEIAKAKAAEDLAKKLLENANFKINVYGDVEGWIEIK